MQKSMHLSPVVTRVKSVLLPQISRLGLRESANLFPSVCALSKCELVPKVRSNPDPRVRVYTLYKVCVFIWTRVRCFFMCKILYVRGTFLKIYIGRVILTVQCVLLAKHVTHILLGKFVLVCTTTENSKLCCFKFCICMVPLHFAFDKPRVKSKRPSHTSCGHWASFQ